MQSVAEQIDNKKTAIMRGHSSSNAHGGAKLSRFKAVLQAGGGTAGLQTPPDPCARPTDKQDTMLAAGE